MPSASQTHHPLSGRAGRPGGEGGQFCQHPGRRRPGGAGQVLLGPGGGRDRLSGHHRHQRRPGHRGGCGGAHRRPGFRPTHCGRRYPYAGGFPAAIPFRVEFIKNHKYTIYEKIINLCDLMCKKVTLTLEKRLIDLILRKGVHENTIYHIQEAQKLKKDIDNMLGFNVYKLFPDILDNE